jgi:hypothetical protein
MRIIFRSTIAARLGESHLLLVLGLRSKAAEETFTNKHHRRHVQRRTVREHAPKAGRRFLEIK